MQKINVVVFVIVAASLIAGWWCVRTYVLPPPPPRETAAAKKAKVQPPKDEGKPAGDQSKPPEVVAKKDEQRPPRDAKPPEPKVEVEAPPKPVPQEPAQDILLVDPKYQDYYLRPTITSRGGGVRNLTLPIWQMADENGNGVFKADKTKAPLELIQDDPIVPSFAMYHYPAPEDPEKIPPSSTLGVKNWKVVSQSSNADISELVLSFDQVPGYPKLAILKTYTLKAREYHIGLTVEIRDQRDPKGTDKKERKFRYQFSGSHGMPVEGEWYTPVHRTPMIGILTPDGQLRRNLEETQYRIAAYGGGDKIGGEALGASMIQYAGVAIPFFASITVVDDKQAPKELGGVSKDDVLDYCRATLESQEVAGFIDHIDNKDNTLSKLYLKTKEALPRTLVFQLLPRVEEHIKKHGLGKESLVFVNFYDPEDGSSEDVAVGVRAGGTPRPQLEDITVRVVSKALALEPGKRVVHKYLLYHGPSKVRLLADYSGDQAVEPELVERYAGTLHLETLTDYHSAGYPGMIASQIGWTRVLIFTTRFMHQLLYWLHKVVPNYGLTIMLLTLLVRGAMFPVSRRSAMLSQKMQALGPEVKKLQEKYKADPQAKNAAVMELYRKNKVNPFGSCLPMMLQMPFFLGLYYCLQESIHFRLAGFLWMDNLAAPDMLIRWGTGIPIISDPDNMSGNILSFLYLGPYFNLLPVIAVSFMLVQMKMMTPPAADEQQEMQQKMMKYMYVFIGIMFYKVASGLCVYFIVSSLWGLCERKLLPKRSSALATAGGPPVASNGGSATGAKPARGKPKPDKRPQKPDTAIQKVKDWWAEVLKQAQKK